MIHLPEGLTSISRRWAYRIIGLVGLMAVLITGAVLRHDRNQDAQACRANLEALYQALVSAERDAGSIPTIALYPEDLVVDPESLLNQLAAYGITPSHCTCPGTAETLKETGITYIWNTRLNGKRWDEFPRPQWVLVEINAMDARVPTPHLRGYHILYSDGTVTLELTPPAIP